jgi:hypothetical protein
MLSCGVLWRHLNQFDVRHTFVLKHTFIIAQDQAVNKCLIFRKQNIRLVVPDFK